MPWDRSSGTDPKYRSREHKAVCAQLKRELEHDGFLICTADECVIGDRTITNSDGRARDGLHAGHEPDGITYRGPQHNACNVTEAAKRARARQITPTRWKL